VTDRVRWLPFRILGSLSKGQTACTSVHGKSTYRHAKRCAKVHTHTQTHAQNVLSNVASFWKTEFPLQSVQIACYLSTAVWPSCPFKLQTVLRCSATWRRADWYVGSNYSVYADSTFLAIICTFHQTTRRHMPEYRNLNNGTLVGHVARRLTQLHVHIHIYIYIYI
jgi:hypothetical protein